MWGLAREGLRSAACVLMTQLGQAPSPQADIGLGWSTSLLGLFCLFCVYKPHTPHGPLGEKPTKAPGTNFMGLWGWVPGPPPLHSAHVPSQNSQLFSRRPFLNPSQLPKPQPSFRLVHVPEQPGSLTAPMVGTPQAWAQFPPALRACAHFCTPHPQLPSYTMMPATHTLVPAHLTLRLESSIDQTSWRYH